MAEPSHFPWWLPGSLCAAAAALFFVTATFADRPAVWIVLGITWMGVAGALFRRRRPKLDTAHADPHKK